VSRPPTDLTPAQAVAEVVRRTRNAAVAATTTIVLCLTGCSSDGSGDARTPGEHNNAAATTSRSPSPRTHATPTVPSATSDAKPTPSVIDPIALKLAHLRLRDKVRQLIVVGFGGSTAPEHIIRSLRPGGLIYFSPNLVSNDQIRAMSRQAQRLARRTGEPLLLMTDQEGGIVTRLPGTSGTPGGADFAGDASLARRTAAGTGRLLERVGVNVDLAPVADVNTAGGGVIGSRSFSSDPDVAARLVQAQVCGYHAGGVATAVKHFPGHGSTSTDSHLSTAKITEDMDTWRRIDLPPFASAVRSHVDIVLLGHLAFPAIDPTGHPATISSRLDRRLLRHQLGFEGVVMTDAMNMGGITSWGSSGSVAVRAIASGVDMLLMPPRPGDVVRGVVAAVRSGRLTEDRLDTSVERVLELKERLGLYGLAKRLPRC
jgi:beta-N-acetylhexosaminidase